MIADPVDEIAAILGNLNRLPTIASPLLTTPVAGAAYVVGAPRLDQVAPRLAGGCRATSTTVPILVVAGHGNAWPALAADVEAAIEALVAAGVRVEAADPVPYQPPDAPSSVPAYQISTVYSTA